MTAQATQPFTVVGFWDDSDTAVPVGVIAGNHSVGGGSGISEGGPWSAQVNAESMEQAEALAVEEMHATLPQDDEDDEESHTVMAFEHEGVAYDIDNGGETYVIYTVDDNAHVTDFHYNGDPEDHYNLEDAAIKALKEKEAEDAK